MDRVIYFITSNAGGFWKGIVYSVEHMNFTQWSILGTLSVVIGFMLLRTQRF